MSNKTESHLEDRYDSLKIKLFLVSFQMAKIL